MSPVHPSHPGIPGASPRIHLANERGSTIVLVAITMTALMSAVALAVDTGMLLTARTEAQRTADAAALAGAGHLINAPNDAAGARAEAVAVGSQNTIIGEPAEILEEDVEVDIAAGRVEVTVWRRTDRGNAVATWFARVFGEDFVDVAANAAAEVASGSGAICMKPWAIPDGWYDANGNNVFDGLPDLGDPLPKSPLSLGSVVETYDPEQYGYGTETGSNFRNSMFPDNGIDPVGTTYYKDRGRPIVLKAGSPDKAISPGWFFPWDMPQTVDGPIVGGDLYNWNIANCNSSLIELGKEYMVENGNMSGPTSQGVQELIEADPYAQWDMSSGQVTGSCCPVSPRIVYVPLFSPELRLEAGKNAVVFNNFTAFFLEDVQGGDVVGRLMQVSGVGLSGGQTGSLIKFARLVQ